MLTATCSLETSTIALVMKIAHYTSELGAHGGIASYVRRLGGALSRRGHEVVYLCTHDGSDDERESVEVDPERVGTAARTLGVDVLHLHRPLPELPDVEVPTLRTMHGNHGSCPSGSRYLKRTGTPCNRDYSVSGCLWGHLVDHCGSRRPHRMASNFRSIEREQHQAANIPTLTVSAFLKDRMIRSGCPPENLHVVPSPAPNVSGAFPPFPDAAPPRFVFAGRIEPKKGVDWLLRSVARTETSAHLDVAGTGSDRYLQKLKTLADDLGIPNRVTFHGWLDGDALETLIERARALVFPSVWHEPAGLVTLEAAAVGRPVIASDVGGIAEYARDGFADLVAARDVSGLARCIDDLARQPGRAQRMGRRGRALARTEFSIGRFTGRMLGIYNRLVASAPASAGTDRRPETG